MDESTNIFGTNIFGANILVVDDTPESLKFLTDMLTSEGYQVYPADSGELALASIAARRPDLIFLDIFMPGVNGFEVCRRLKSREETRRIPIIFISVSTETTQQVEGLRLGAVDFVIKPFRREVLLARLRTHLELSRLRSRLEQQVEERTDELRQANERLQIELAELQRAENQLSEALKEKEALLRELYHRTKNNMQVIASLLSLQTSYVADEQVSRVFKDMENRIRAMALVHQKLYQVGNLSSINLGEYANDLAILLVKSYEVSSDKIKLVVEAEDINVLLETAIPCGLILNELITNALKYAFPGDRAGDLYMRVRKAEAGMVEMEVADNGIGVAADFDFRENGKMGVQTVFIIAENQLGGEVTVQSRQGVAWLVRFKNPAHD